MKSPDFVVHIYPITSHRFRLSLTGILGKVNLFSCRMRLFLSSVAFSVSSSSWAFSIFFGQTSATIISRTGICLGYVLSLRSCCRVTTAFTQLGFQSLSGSFRSPVCWIFPIKGYTGSVTHHAITSLRKYGVLIFTFAIGVSILDPSAKTCWLDF